MMMMVMMMMMMDVIRFVCGSGLSRSFLTLTKVLVSYVVSFYGGSCLYLATKFFPDEEQKEAEQLLQDHAICLCDDDNDLEMAMGCGHAYVPQISSASMKDVIDRYPEHFTQTGGEGIELNGTDSSEAALLLVLKKLNKEEDLPNDENGS
jgi:hypothetical protein